MGILKRLIERDEKAKAAGPAPPTKRISWHRRIKSIADAEQMFERVRERTLAARQREEARSASEARKARNREIYKNPRPAGKPGTANPEAQWVRILVSMQPGRWYGTRVLEEITGVHKPLYRGCKWATRLFVDQARNPKPKGYWRGGTPRKGPRGCLEPEHLWRLNVWGEALRATVLDRPHLTSINVLALNGAKPDEWKRARMLWKNRPLAPSRAKRQREKLERKRTSQK